MPCYNRGPREYPTITGTLQCTKCPAEFEATYVTRVPKLCPACKPAADQAYKDREKLRRKEAKAKGQKPRKPLKPMPKLIPYAGYRDEEDCRRARLDFYRPFRQQA